MLTTPVGILRLGDRDGRLADVYGVQASRGVHGVIRGLSVARIIARHDR